ncbi:MAG: hypothetical protein GY852_05930 [bacterium]|nr:hypothetical protein [bacterium]
MNNLNKDDSMDIGMPKERKMGETRVALIPKDVGKLVEAGHFVFVETGAGAGAGFSDEEYEKNGAKIEDSVWKHRMIVKAKVEAKDPFEENQILMGYLHVEKGQSPELLDKLLEKRMTGYAFEEIRDSNGIRMVNLGYEAGIVGMYEGLRQYGELLEKNGCENPFGGLPEIKTLGKDEAFKRLSGLELGEELTINIMGAGNVSRGVQEILKNAGITPQVLREKDTAHIEDYLPDTDILVNAISWFPGKSHVVTRKMLGLMKKTALIVDISCDENGGIETCVPTKWANPTYEVDGITHACIDNLPTAIAKDSSEHLSSMILPFVLKVANGNELRTGLMTKDGECKFKQR